jgi:hypothetical protein
MKKISPVLLVFVALMSCQEKTVGSDEVTPVNWNKRSANLTTSDSLQQGVTYLSVYSQIYSRSEHRRHDLTATVSLRNVSIEDTIYVSRAQFFGTEGKLIRTYFDQPIFILPLETVEIVIQEVDNEGGTGGNFIFEWMINPGTPEPLFEAVMISTSGQQGISFTTRGIQIR